MGKIFSVKIGPLDGAIVGGGIAHVGPIEVLSFEVHNDAVGEPTSLAHDDFHIRAVRVRGKNFATACTEKKQAGGSGLCLVLLDL